MKTIASTFITIALILGTGCTHTARITNGAKFAPVKQQPETPVTVGFAPVKNDRLLSAAIKEIKARPVVTKAEEDFKPGNGFRPDYVSHLSRETKFKASGQNFFITFPGFIVFTHALVGYKYTAHINTESRLTDADGNLVCRTNIVTPIEFRHCSFARGASAGCCGWVVPGYGAAAIIPGVIFAASYDKRATAEFTEKAEPIYGPYVASRVLAQMCQVKGNRSVQVTEPLPGQPAGRLGEAEPAETASPTASEYAVYVMKRDGNELAEPETSVRELPDSARQILDQMSATGLMPAERELEEVLLCMGFSQGDIFGQLEEAQIHTQVGENIVALQDAPRGE